MNCLLCVSHFPRDVFSEHAYKTERSIAREIARSLKINFCAVSTVWNSIMLYVCISFYHSEKLINN